MGPRDVVVDDEVDVFWLIPTATVVVVAAVICDCGTAGVTVVSDIAPELATEVAVGTAVVATTGGDVVVGAAIGGTVVEPPTVVEV